MKTNKKNTVDESVFQNRDKEAKFWEENFDNAFASGKSTKISFAKNLSESINIRLDAKSLTIVRKQAREKGLGPTQLIRMWVMEKIKHPQMNA